MAFAVQKESLGSSRCITTKIFLILAIFSLLLAIVSGETLIRPIESQSSKQNKIVDKKGQAYFFRWRYLVMNTQHIIQEWYLTEGNKTTMIISQNGQNGVPKAVSKLPDTLAGRIFINGKSNGVLMVVTSYYSDTGLQFSSKVKARKTSSSSYITYDLKPICTVTVRGPPEFKSIPQNHISVAENGQLQVTARFDGNPQPTAELQWSRQNANISMTVKEQQKRFIYNATYILNPVSSSYCGKTLSVRAKNSVGRTADVSTYVDVVLSLDAPNLEAHKPNDSCVVVQWRKKDTGECNIMYIVNFKDINAKTVYASGGINVHKAMQCGIPYDVNITHVELTMGSKTKSKVFKVAVDESLLPPPTTKQPTTQKNRPSTTSKDIATSSSKTKTGKNAQAKSMKTSEATSNNLLALHIGYGIVVIIMASLIVLLVIREFRNKKNKGINLPNPTAEGAPAEHPEAQLNMHYMALQAQERAREQYAKLSTAAYEVTDPEIKNKSPYVNFGNATYMTKNEM